MSMNFETPDQFAVHYRYGYGGISRFFREIVEGPRLFITRCPGCGEGYCPPRADCPTCWAETEWEEHEGSGTIVSLAYCYWAPIDSPVRDFVDLPYVYGLVRLDRVSNCLNTLIHVDDLTLNVAVAIGDRVRIEYREVRDGKITDYFFRKAPTVLIA